MNRRSFDEETILEGFKNLEMLLIGAKDLNKLKS